MDPESGFQICSKLALNWKNDKDGTNCQHGVIINFFFDVFVFLLSCFMLLVQVSCQYDIDYLELGQFSELPPIQIRVKLFLIHFNRLFI